MYEKAATQQINTSHLLEKMVEKMSLQIVYKKRINTPKMKTNWIGYTPFPYPPTIPPHTILQQVYATKTLQCIEQRIFHFISTTYQQS